jgi:hypothetical protein
VTAVGMTRRAFDITVAVNGTRATMPGTLTGEWPDFKLMHGSVAVAQLHFEPSKAKMTVVDATFGKKLCRRTNPPCSVVDWYPKTR